MCRFTHVYPDGPAPYFTVLAPARRGSEVEQWDEVKAAASEAIISAGGTITHHHAVGRDHRPWYDMQRPDPFAEALAGAKRAVDPGGILNPGVLIDPALVLPAASPVTFGGVRAHPAAPGVRPRASRHADGHRASPATLGHSPIRDRTCEPEALRMPSWT